METCRSCSFIVTVHNLSIFIVIYFYYYYYYIILYYFYYYRSVTKEEKEKENTRKVAPISNMPPAGRPSSVQARPIYEILQDDLKAVVSIQST